MFDIKKFEKIKIEAEKFYQSIGSVYCPYFKEKVHFNSLGLEHLKFKRREKTRSIQDQYMRMKLLHFAPKILAQSNTLQGRLDMKSFEKVRINNRTEHMLKGVTYYEFFAIIEMVRIKIVVREVFGQEKIFWSIIPYWRYSKNRQRKMYHGNPKED